MRGTEHKSKAVQAAGRVGKGPINEVVCGAMMLAYERAGKWEQVSPCINSLFLSVQLLIRKVFNICYLFVCEHLPLVLLSSMVSQCRSCTAAAVALHLSGW